MMHVGIRVDATLRSGTGHVMRCLALADQLQEQGAKVVFLSRHLIGQLPLLIRERGHNLAMLPAPTGWKDLPSTNADTDSPVTWLSVDCEQDASEAGRVLQSGSTVDWLVVDHYALDARWERAMRGYTRKILAIDDLADRPHDADLLLDQNLHENASLRYSELVPPSCIVLLGPRYALLRPEFGTQRASLAPRGDEVRRILVLMGGADARNFTSLALDVIALLETPGLQVDVVVGSAHPALEKIRQRCAAYAGTQLHVDPTDVANLMAGADLCIGAGGTATWERCALGLPTLAVCLAENQRQVLRNAAEHGLLLFPSIESTSEALVTHLRALMENAGLRRLLSRQGLLAVDALGAQRVAQLMDRIVGVRWREATMTDAEALFTWRNDLAVRNVSHNSDAIDFARHEAWLAAAIEDANRHLLIAEYGGRPLGVVRFDVERCKAKVSIYRVPGRSERSVGAVLLSAAEEWLHQRRPDVTHLTAEVLANNLASQELFENCGYESRVLTYEKRIRQ